MIKGGIPQLFWGGRGVFVPYSPQNISRRKSLMRNRNDTMETKLKMQLFIGSFLPKHQS